MLWTIWFESPLAMKPAPIMATRIGRPSASRACSALSTMIMVCLSGAHAHAGFEIVFDLIEPLPLAIFVRRRRHRQRPGEAEPRIVVEQAALRAGRVELADVIGRFRVVHQRLVA